jgi:hypothetical protein
VLEACGSSTPWLRSNSSDWKRCFFVCCALYSGHACESVGYFGTASATIADAVRVRKVLKREHRVIRADRALLGRRCPLVAPLCRLRGLRTAYASGEGAKRFGEGGQIG